MVFVLKNKKKIESISGINKSSEVEKYTFIIQDHDDGNDTSPTLKELNDVMEQIRFGIERQVKKSTLDNFYDKYFISSNIFDEAIINAWEHGNKSKLGTKIDVDVKYGLLGCVVYIEDIGNGFDYRTLVKKVQKCKHHVERFDRGRGMKHFNASAICM